MAHRLQYAEWIQTLLEAMAVRYGQDRASSFWFRVGTEPNTRPGLSSTAILPVNA